MRPLIYILATLAVMALGYWANAENIKTQIALDEVEDLEREIGGMRERALVLKAEWAYLNRPDRLRDLSEMSFDRLGLLPLRPEQFGRVDQVSYPELPDRLPALDDAGSVDVVGRLEAIEDVETRR